jgi:hypothetical protein
MSTCWNQDLQLQATAVPSTPIGVRQGPCRGQNKRQKQLIQTNMANQLRAHGAECKKLTIAYRILL